jgi:hypothetical protein
MTTAQLPTTARFVPAVQWLDTCKTGDEARDVLASMALQVGFLGGRVLPPSDVTPTWRAQGFMDATGVDQTDWLPAGLRWVLAPTSLLTTEASR